MLHEDFANAGWLLASVSDHLPRDLGSRHEALELRLAQLQSAPVEEAIDALEEALDEPDFSGELALALLIEFPAVQLQGYMHTAGVRERKSVETGQFVSRKECCLHMTRHVS